MTRLDELGLKRRLGVSLLTTVSIQALSIVTGVLLARTLGAHGRGALAAVLLWPAFLAAIGCLGLPDSTTYHAARSAVRTGAIAGGAVAIALAQAALIVGIGVTVLPHVLARYGHEAVVAGYLALTFVPVYLLTLYLMNTLNGLQRATAYQALRFLVVAATAVMLIALAAAGRLTVTTAVAVQVVAHGVAGVVAVALVLRAVDGPIRVEREVLRQLLSFGVRSHVNGVAVELNERLDQAVISVFLAPVSLGLYVIAVSMTSLTTLVGAAVSIVALPAVARLERAEEKLAAARRCIALAAGASLLVTVPIFAFAPRLIELFFGASFAPAATVARVLLAAAVVLSTSRAIAAVLTALGRPLDAALPELLGLVATVATLAALVPVLGLLGAGIASLAAYGLTFVWILRRAGRALGIPSALLLVPERGDGLLAPGVEPS